MYNTNECLHASKKEDIDELKDVLESLLEVIQSDGHYYLCNLYEEIQERSCIFKKFIKAAIRESDGTCAIHNPDNSKYVSVIDKRNYRIYLLEEWIKECNLILNT